MDVTESLGYWIRRRRKALDLTQEELARRVGCAVITLRKMEADERRPSRQMAERFAQCLELPPADLPHFLAIAAQQRMPVQVPPSGALPDRPFRGNLPALMTTLVGRTTELTAIVTCLRRKEIRLHTLTGPVGVGKTRLAIEAGHRLLDDYRHGVYLVSLASTHDASLIPSLTAAALGVREGSNRGPTQAVADYLARREILLIFDEFDHLQPGAPYLASLLASAPDLHLLVTSRSSLGLYGEHEFRVAPLPLPEPSADPQDSLTSAVQLFVDRAHAARADFHLTPELTPTIAEICRRLDGLPLAIELAASRIKLVSPRELLKQLGCRLTFLAQPAADQPGRLHSLEGAIDWSYALLAPVERRLMARLAVFVGNFSLEAVEQVCGLPFTEPGYPTTQPMQGMLEQLGVLISHSLLYRSDSGFETRFAMLQTIREFALERLTEISEDKILQDRHAAYYAALATQAEGYFHGPDQASWLDRLESEMENLHATLDWLLVDGQLELAARMASALGTYWGRRGLLSEGRRWIERVLDSVSADRVSPGLRAKLYQTAGALAYHQGDFQKADHWLRDSLALYQGLDDRTGKARVLFDLGWIAIEQGKWAQADQYNRESLALAQESQDLCGIYRALSNLGWASLSTGQCELAASFFTDAHTYAGLAGHSKGIAVSLTNLGWIALHQSDLPRAVRAATQSLLLCYQLKEPEVLAENLEMLAIAAARQGHAGRGACLGGAAEALWQSMGVLRLHVNHTTREHAEAVSLMLQQLTEGPFAAAWQQGRTLSLESVVAMVAASL